MHAVAEEIRCASSIPELCRDGRSTTVDCDSSTPFLLGWALGGLAPLLSRGGGGSMDALWRIELLGWLRAVQAGQVVARFQAQQTGALLAYLALHGDRPHPRDELMELLWPEVDPQAGRQRLRQALSSLRQHLEPRDLPAGSVILADRATVQLNTEISTTDVVEFHAALQAAARAVNDEERAQRFTEAVELYQGELLPGYFDNWVLQEREWLAERYFQALHELLAHLEHAGEIPRALQYAQRGVRADPLREEAHRDLMRLYAAVGQPDAALRQYRELARVLRRELGATPDEATRALARDLEERSLTAHAHGGAPGSRLQAPSPAKEVLVPAWSLEPGAWSPPPTAESPGEPIRVILLYKRQAQPDERLLRVLEAHLAAHGCQVFIDRHLAIGVEWARELERQIRTADAVIPLLSAASVESEMLACEVQIAHEAAQQQNGRPRLLPVRVGEIDPLPEPLAVVLAPLEYTLWEGPQDDARVAAELVSELQNPGSPRGGEDLPLPALPRVDLEPVGGVVPVGSAFYVVRATDAEFHAALARQDSIVLVKGARQTGKTSLLARGLQHARAAGARVVLTDCQMFNASHLQTVERFLLALAQSLAAELDLDVWPQEVWNPENGANLNLELYLRREVLGKIDGPLVWGLDEVDRLFPCDFGSEVFGLFRSWHNRRHLNPASSWSRLTLAIAYATEAHLFITDLNQSPFNVGTRLALEDLTREHVADLNRRYLSPLRSEAEVDRFYRMVGGQPYLVRRGLHEMTTLGMEIGALEAQADRDHGLFGDHLRRMLVLLAKDPGLCEAVRGVLEGQACPTAESFYRLRAAGVLAGEAPRDARPRCQLYATYLAQHLV
jgi:DNA-binding SARP family transcriptional activator